MGEHSVTLTLTNKRGLHARASAEFVRTVQRHNADVTVSRDGQSVSGASILDLLLLAAPYGSDIEIACSGDDAAEVLAALTALVDAKFNEE